MVNPGAFQGSRKEFLISEKPYYKAALEEGMGAEAIVHIQRRYFKRYPIDLPHDEEPSEDILAGVDDDAPDPDFDKRFEDLLSSENDASRRQKLAERQQLVEFRKGQIKRWMTYQYMKDGDGETKDTSKSSNHASVIFKLTGKDPHRPRLKTAVNMWRKDQRIPIESVVKIRAAKEGVDKTGLAALRDKVAREIFASLSQEERDEWRKKAEQEHEDALEEWKKKNEGGVSKSPTDRQKCIQGLVGFLQPLLDEVCEVTGWKASLLLGGPEPAHGGRLNCVSVHAGTSGGDVKMNFGQMERARYKKYILPIFGDFLKRCYTPEECRARALTTGNPFISVGKFDVGTNEDNVHLVDTMEPPPPEPFPANPKHPTAEGTSQRPPENRTPIESRKSTPTVSKSTPPNDGIHPHSVEPSLSGGREQSTNSETPLTSNPLPPEVGRSSAARNSLPLDDDEVASMLMAELMDPAALDGDFEAPSPPQSPASDEVQSSNRDKDPASLAPNSPSTAKPISGGNSRSKTKLPIASTSQKGSTMGGEKRKRLGGAEEVLNAVDRESPPPIEVDRSSKRRRKDSSTTSSTQILSSLSSTSSSHHLRIQSPETASSRPRRSLRKVPEPDPSTQSPPPSVSAPIRIALSPNAPEWFRSVMEMLQLRNLGDNWRKILDVWARFEERHDFEDRNKRRLGSAHRPKAVAEWIKRHCSPTWVPPVDNYKDYAAELQKWWSSLQLEWRQDGAGGHLPLLSGDWSVLERPGLNGLVNVLVALYYLGVFAHDMENPGSIMTVWVHALEDCHKVFSLLP